MGWLHRRSAVAARIGWMLAVSRDFLGKFDAATRRLRLDGGGSPLRTVLCPGFPGIRENYGESFLRIELLADKKPRKSFCFPTFATAASVTRAQIGAENLKFGIREAIRPLPSRWERCSFVRSRVKSCSFTGVSSLLCLTRIGQTNHPGPSERTSAIACPYQPLLAPLARLPSLGPRRCARAGQGRLGFHCAARCEIWRR